MRLPHCRPLEVGHDCHGAAVRRAVRLGLTEDQKQAELDRLRKRVRDLQIDAERVREVRRKGSFATAATMVGLIIMPAFWVGGGLYQVNQQLDESLPSWYATEIVDKRVSKSQTTSYDIVVTPWLDQLDGPVEISVRRSQFDVLAVGMTVEVGVYPGALQIPYVAEIRPVW